MAERKNNIKSIADDFVAIILKSVCVLMLFALTVGALALALWGPAVFLEVSDTMVVTCGACGEDVTSQNANFTSTAIYCPDCGNKLTR